MPASITKAELQENYDTLLNQYKWLHAVSSILVLHAGGKVNIAAEVLETHPLDGGLTVSLDEQARLYTVEVYAAPPVEDEVKPPRRRPRKKDTSE